MQIILCLSSVLVLGPSRTEFSQAENSAQAIVNKAIQAHGGKELAAKKANTKKLKGVYFAADKAIANSASVATEGKQQTLVEIRTDGWEMISVVNGETGWIKENGVLRMMNERDLAETMEDLHIDWVSRLAFHNDVSVTLTSLGEVKIGNRPAVGVRVSQKGYPDVDLFFDTATWLLAKNKRKCAGPDRFQVEYETTFSDYKVFDGIKSWTKFSTFRDGKKIMETEVIEARFLDKLPPQTFAKP